MATNPAADRRHDAVKAQLAEERYRAESEATRRANILEHGTPAELAALRAEHAEQAARGHELVVRARAARGDHLAELEVLSDFRTRWTTGEPPAAVTWTRASDGR